MTTKRKESQTEMDLPHFTYHPDPIATGAVERSNKKCQACGQARGYLYMGPVYFDGDDDPDLCPWCIADGTAAQKYTLQFVDEFEGPGRIQPDDEIQDEIRTRTPSYPSYQDPVWLYHCEDACAYLGEADIDDLGDLTSEVEQWFMDTNDLDEEQWENIKETYAPGGDPGIYKFECRKCGTTLLHMEWA